MFFNIITSNVQIFVICLTKLCWAQLGEVINELEYKEHKPIRFSDGKIVPFLGFGAIDGEFCEDVSSVAMDLGYRLFEVTTVAMNEKCIGNTLRRVFEKRKIKREDVVIVHKLWNTQHRPKELFKGVKYALQNLGLEYLDVCMLHWPLAWEPTNKTSLTHYEDFTVSLEETYKAMEELVSMKLVRRLGLANVNSNQIRRILKIAKIKPEVIEFEISIYLTQFALINYCKSEGMVIFSPPPQFKQYRISKFSVQYNHFIDPYILQLSRKYSKYPAQISLKFLYQNRIIPLIKTSNPITMVTYRDILDFNLTDEEMEHLKSLNKDFRTVDLNEHSHREYPFYRV